MKRYIFALVLFLVSACTSTKQTQNFELEIFDTTFQGQPIESTAVAKKHAYSCDIKVMVYMHKNMKQTNALFSLKHKYDEHPILYEVDINDDKFVKLLKVLKDQDYLTLEEVEEIGRAAYIIEENREYMQPWITN